MDSKVYWITGLSSAGKTTIGVALYEKLRLQLNNVVILDGDVLKDIFDGESAEYTSDARKTRALKYSKLCKMLSEQGITVICCTISMYDSIRLWNRNNIENYTEIFLDVPKVILKKRDTKNIYSYNDATDSLIFEGFGEEIEFPAAPSLTIKNDGRLSVNQCVDMILNSDKRKILLENSDTKYWDEFYRKKPPIDFQSKFAEFVSEFIEKGKTMIDLGCGNGRDSVYFNRLGLKVTAVDISSVAISILNSQAEYKDINFICADFVNSELLFNQYDYCYCRFVMHAISENQQNKLLPNIYNSLNENGKLFIEARSTNDEIYGKGVEICKDTFFYENHCRRFLRIDKLKIELINVGFSISYCDESSDFAPLNNSNPAVIRIIAEKGMVDK